MQIKLTEKQVQELVSMLAVFSSIHAEFLMHDEWQLTLSRDRIRDVQKQAKQISEMIHLLNKKSPPKNF